ncbi:hypothetical protein D3C74_208210 [compost metagenome]
MSDEQKLKSIRETVCHFFENSCQSEFDREEVIEFMGEIFQNLSLHLRPLFKSDLDMVKVANEMMIEALKNRKIEVIVKHYPVEDMKNNDA